MRRILSSKIRGAALVEMAVMVPVLCILFLGMMDLVSYARVKNMTALVANTVSGATYAIRTIEAGTPDLIDSVLQQVEGLAMPFDPPQVTIRFCEWNNGSMWRNYKETVGSSPGCATDAQTCGQLATGDGHGAFVQTTVCHSFTPLVTSSLFNVFGRIGSTGNMSVQSIAYLPLSDANQTQMLANLAKGGGHQPDGGGSVPCPPNCPTTTTTTPTTTTTTSTTTTTTTTSTTTTTTTLQNCPKGYSFTTGGCHVNCPVFDGYGQCISCPIPGRVTSDGKACVADTTCPTGQIVHPRDNRCVSDCGGKVCNPGNDLNYDTCACDLIPCSSTEERINGVCVPQCGSDAHRDSNGNCITCSGTQVWNAGQCCATCQTGFIMQSSSCSCYQNCSIYTYPDPYSPGSCLPCPASKPTNCY